MALQFNLLMTQFYKLSLIPRGALLLKSVIYLSNHLYEARKYCQDLYVNATSVGFIVYLSRLSPPNLYLLPTSIRFMQHLRIRVSLLKICLIASIYSFTSLLILYIYKIPILLRSNIGILGYGCRLQAMIITRAIRDAMGDVDVIPTVETIA